MILGKLTRDFLATVFVPSRFDRWVLPRLIRRLVPPETRMPGPWMTEVERRMRFVLKPFLPDLDYRDQAACFRERLIEAGWIKARAVQGKRLRVSTSVEGLEHLGTDGAVLWGMSFGGSLMVKIALARAGIPLVHLSAAGHGGAHPPTTLGLKVVSLLYCLSENRFLAERVVIPVDGSRQIMRTLIDRLHQGCVVFIAGERGAETSTIATCLGRPTPFARGAPGLAHKTQVPLLPTAVVREGILDYRLIIGPPIQVDRASSRADFIEQAIGQFAERVGRTVLARPSDWDWYRHTVPMWEGN